MEHSMKKTTKLMVSKSFISETCQTCLLFLWSRHIDGCFRYSSRSSNSDLATELANVFLQYLLMHTGLPCQSSDSWTRHYHLLVSTSQGSVQTVTSEETTCRPYRVLIAACLKNKDKLWFIYYRGKCKFLILIAVGVLNIISWSRLHSF